MRKTIQIAVSGAEDAPDNLYALADDGTIWTMIMDERKMHWEQIPDLPQERERS